MRVHPIFENRQPMLCIRPHRTPRCISSRTSFSREEWHVPILLPKIPSAMPPKLLTEEDVGEEKQGPSKNPRVGLAHCRHATSVLSPLRVSSCHARQGLFGFGSSSRRSKYVERMGALPGLPGPRLKKPSRTAILRNCLMGLPIKTFSSSPAHLWLLDLARVESQTPIPGQFHTHEALENEWRCWFDALAMQ